MTDYSATADAPIRFESEQLFDAIERCSAPSFDLLEFGVIGFDRTGVVRRYNAMESRLGGLAASTVVGHHLFDVVAPCMNNFMVAERFIDALSERRALDIVIDYVLTLRMRPQRVKLRLLAQPDADMRYVLVQRNL